MRLQEFAEAIWKEGFWDITSLRRQRSVLETVAETADRIPDEVDYDGSICILSFSGKHYTDRRLSFRFMRLGGSTKIIVDGAADEVSNGFSGWTATVVTVKQAFQWLDAEPAAKPKRKKVKK